MSHYELYVQDEYGRSASWSHARNGNSGLQPCLYFADDQESVIILDHPSMRTMLFLSPDGTVEIVQEKKVKPRRRRPRRRSSRGIDGY